MAPVVCPDVSRFSHFWTNSVLVPHVQVTFFSRTGTGPPRCLLTPGLETVLRTGTGPPRCLLTPGLETVLQGIRPQLVVCRVYETL